MIPPADTPGSGSITVLAGGLLATIQDRGRRGLRRFGVPTAGALSPAWMTIANALVGNDAESPIIEIFEGGLRLLACERAVRIAHAGDGDVVLLHEGQKRSLSPWRSHVVPPGAELAIRGSGQGRLVVLAIAGLSVPPMLGSASTYARAQLGGVSGQPLTAGDTLTLSTAETGSAGPNSETRWADIGCAPFAPPQPAQGEPLMLEALPGPQQDAFDTDMLDQFFATIWTLTSDADRMGARLDGPKLVHRSPAERDIVSDAIVAGSVQVPGSGLPIIMLADSHTAGGYPKIATLTSGSLGTLAVQRPGTRFVIKALDIDTAIDRARQDAQKLAAHLDAFHTLLPDTIDATRLMSENLVDGVTDGKMEDQ